ncbi:MAG: polyprenyl diphosphate synthase [Succinivibrionaceae bacterium]
MNKEQIAIYQKKSSQTIPEHVAIIMDGNGRWARALGKHRLHGHKAGVKSVRVAVSYAAKIGVKELTLFAFSSENWRRPDDEVSGLMELFSIALAREVRSLVKNNIRLQIIGDLKKFSKTLQHAMQKAVELTESNTGLLLNIAVNYGGRWEIVEAVKSIASIYKEHKINDINDITESLIEEYLKLPRDVDLLIRTGGENRISNFLLWQIAYSEIYVSDKLWPEFDENIFSDAINYFASRERRFGCTGEQIRAEI